MKYLAILLLTIFIGSGLYAQSKPSLAILPFTGENSYDAETIAEFFSFQPDIERNFTIIPRTSAIENVIKEHLFQRAGLTDSDTIAQMGKQLNADFVLSGHITGLGSEKLLMVMIVSVEHFQQIAGNYRRYSRIEETIHFLPAMARRILNATRQDTSKLSRLAVLPFNTLAAE